MIKFMVIIGYNLRACMHAGGHSQKHPVLHSVESNRIGLKRGDPHSLLVPRLVPPVSCYKQVWLCIEHLARARETRQDTPKVG
jgi:hypothetical protein